MTEAVRGRGRGISLRDMKDYVIGPGGLVYEPNSPKIFNSDDNPELPPVPPPPPISTSNGKGISDASHELKKQGSTKFSSTNGIKETQKKKYAWDNNGLIDMPIRPTTQNLRQSCGHTNSKSPNNNLLDTLEMLTLVKSQADSRGRLEPIFNCDGADIKLLPTFDKISSQGERHNQVITFRFGKNSPSMAGEFIDDKAKFFYVDEDCSEEDLSSSPRIQKPKMTTFVLQPPQNHEHQRQNPESRKTGQEGERNLDFFGKPKVFGDPKFQWKPYVDYLASLPPPGSPEFRLIKPVHKRHK